MSDDNEKRVEIGLQLLDGLHGKTIPFSSSCAVCTNRIDGPNEICETCRWQEDTFLDDGWSYANGEFLAEAQTKWNNRVIN